MSVVFDNFSKIGISYNDFVNIGNHQIYLYSTFLIVSIVLFLLSWILYKKLYKYDENIVILIIFLMAIGIILLAISVSEIPNLIFYITDPKSWVVKFILDNYKIIILK